MPYLQRSDRVDYARRYYRDNKAISKERAREYTRGAIERSRKFIILYLESHPCVDCGEKDGVVLEFDHVRGVKSKHIAALVANGCSVDRIRREIEKCDVRCANCHRRRTAKERGWYRSTGECSVKTK